MAELAHQPQPLLVGLVRPPSLPSEVLEAQLEMAAPASAAAVHVGGQLEGVGRMPQVGEALAVITAQHSVFEFVI